MYIAASAGSGKTYQLVNRFIALLSLQQLATGKPEVGRLIAITFTRKAAGEFKERILAALAEAAQGEESAARFWQQRVWPTIADARTGICPGAEEPQIASLHAFFTLMLRELTNAFSKLNLSTIDSLFQRMVGTLSHELGLNSFATLDEAQEENCRRRALDLTYLKHGSSGNAELEAAINDCFPGEERLGTPDANIFELVKTYHSSVLNAPDALWGGAPAELTDAELALFGLTRADITPRLGEEEFDAAVQKLQSLLEDDDPKNFRTYVGSIADTGSSLAPQPKRKWPEFMERVEAEGLNLEEILHSRAAFYWRRLLTRTQALRHLIRDFERQYGSDVRARGLHSFDDVPRLLRDRITEESVQLMEERTDARLDHWLLDEFQDTSHSQFAILRDLLVNRASAEDGSIFMVGDAKQSIYQFRGGDPRIFMQARASLFGLPEGVESREESAQMPLDTSYRSTQPVLDFANELFGDIDRYAANSSEAARELWKHLGYNEHKAAPHMAGRPGEVAIYRAWRKGDDAPLDEDAIPGVDDKEDGNMFRTLAAILAEKRPETIIEYEDEVRKEQDKIIPCPRRATQKVPGCAILVRNHREEVALHRALTALQPEYGFQGPIVICSDNEVGSDSPAGTALTHLFRWLNAPGDETSLSLLRLTPLHTALVHAFGADEGALWHALHSIMAASGVSGLLRRLTACCPELECNEFMRQRLNAWMNAADAFDSTGGTLDEWLVQVEALLVREEPQGNAIRIMTCFKAKGLEFDMVLLPQFAAARDMADYTKVNLLTRRDSEGTPLAVLLAPGKDAMEGTPAVRRALYEPWRTEQEFSAFCVLYVAVTRAKYATYVVIPTFSEEKKDGLTKDEAILEGLRESESVSGMMLQLACNRPIEDKTYYVEPGELDAPATCIYHLGSDRWDEAWLHSQPDDDAPAPQEEPAPAFAFRTLARTTPSGEAAAARVEARRRLCELPRTNFGIAVHAAFEQVAWLAEGEEPAFPAAADAEAEAAQATVRRALTEPAVRALFTKPAAPCRLFREQGIEALRRGREWVSGQIDRLVVEYADAACKQPLRALIIDFKSDRCEAAALKPEYAPQMKSYREMVALAFGLPEEAVRVTLIHAPRVGEPSTQPYAAEELQ